MKLNISTESPMLEYRVKELYLLKRRQRSTLPPVFIKVVDSQPAL